LKWRNIKNVGTPPCGCPLIARVTTRVTPTPEAANILRVSLAAVICCGEHFRKKYLLFLFYKVKLKLRTLILLVIKMTAFYPRNLEPQVSNLLDTFPIVAIIGARQVGKTTLAQTVARNFNYIDLENPADYDRITRDPAFFFSQYPEHVIFDEAQSFPELFAILRGVVDANRQQKGRFILTGSSSPELLKHISESLAGRVAIIEMDTLKTNEFYRQPLSHIYQAFTQPLDKEKFLDGLSQTPQLDVKQVHDFWLRGGYPEPLDYGANDYQAWMENYQSTYINRDIAKLFPQLDKIAYRRFLSVLGKLSSKIINKSDLARAIGVTEPTIRNYLQIVAGTFLWRLLPSYENSAIKSVVKMPRGHIRDSGLLHHLLKIASLEQLQNDPIAGFSFEAFMIEEILKGLQAAQIRNVSYYYYRTRNGAEIDLILHGSFGVLPIEIKYGSTISGRQLKALREFIDVNNLPFGVLVNQATEVEWLSEQIIQVPAIYW
jgi:predicted AAA+ superfamily ATPase